MLFMPFNVLGVWFRALLSLVLIGAGIWLLILWNNNREVVVRELGVIETRDTTRPDAPVERVPEVRERVVHWEFGPNRETAFLLGGVALLAWSLGGGWLSVPLLRLARRGGGQPTDVRGETHTIHRPDGTVLHVECFGPAEAPPVVLTHGWGLDSSEWVYAKKELADRFRLIVWDLPGLGRSTGPRDRNWDLEKMARDLEAVLELAGDRPAILLGHSIGGMITLTYCRLFPQALGPRVCGLVIAQSTYTNPIKTAKHAALLTALQKPVLEPLAHLMVWLAPVLYVLNWLSYLNGSVHRSVEKGSFSGRETWGQLDYLSRHYVRAWPGVVGRGFLAMFRYDATGVLQTIPVPALVVAGDRDDNCTPPASELMSTAVDGGRLVVLNDAKHCGLFEHHGAFDGAVAEFAGACFAPADQGAPA